VWSWRCAWADGVEPSPWVERYRGPLKRYNRQAIDNKLPTIARVWGAIRDGEGEAAVIVDQENLRAWAWAGGHQELVDESPVQRMRVAASIALD
jgi:hypothetical protein